MSEGITLKASSIPVVARLKNLEREQIRGIRQGWFKVGDQLKKRANEQILHRPKSGRLYRFKGRRHRASAPGESPANRTGTYRRSIGYQIKGYKELEFGSRKTGNAPYSVFLELGTRRMAPRPGLKNAIDVEEGTIQAILSAELRKALS